MEARIVREELQKCQKAEGVNHYAVCKPLVETYLELLKDAKVSATAKDRAEGHGQSRSYGQKRFRSSKRGHSNADEITLEEDEKGPAACRRGKKTAISVIEQFHNRDG